MIAAREDLMSTLDSATGLVSYEHDAQFQTVKFDHGVESMQRASMWTEGSTVHLGMWAGELKPQFLRVYKSARVINALTALGEGEWILRPNFHLAFHNSHWKQRWYPSNKVLSAEDYMRQWMTDLPIAGRFPRAEIEAPSYSRWLVDRRYITEVEAVDLSEWLGGMRRQQIDVRPSILIERVWEEMPSAPEVRDSINDVLTALGEPLLGQRKTTTPRVRKADKTNTRTPEDRPLTMCPQCFVALPATGVCDCG